MHSAAWKTSIKNGDWDSTFTSLYSGDIENQRTRYVDTVESFEKHFGAGELSFFSAGGRVEIIGNHTDHNLGRVLTAAVNLDTLCAARKNGTDTVRLVSKGYKGTFSIDLSVLTARQSERGTTTALVRGIASRLRESGYEIGGFDGYISSNVLRGSGLSSSASVEAVLTRIFVSLFNDKDIDGITNARISQYAEREYFGKPCGLMDQTACAVGGIMTIDFNDDARMTPIHADFNSELTMVVVDTHADHADLTDEYASITHEMRSVAEFFGKKMLIEVDENEFFARIGELSACVSDRALLRARHFFDENRNVMHGAEALNNGDLQGFFDAVNASGESSWKYLQNLYVGGSSQQRICLALMLAQRAIGSEGACRVHGGGFGGTILCFMKNDVYPRFVHTLAPVFGANSIHRLSVRPAGSIKLD